MGHSKAKPKCTTYSSPMLSSSEEFVIDSVELWGVGPPKLPEVRSLYGSVTAINSDTLCGIVTSITM